MAPLIPTAKVTLSYPLYACDFDPLDAARLVVGGGGGGSKTGVKNLVTVLDTSDPAVAAEVGELEASLEDSVASLAAGPHKGKTTQVFAGVNSSPQDLKQGKNQHLRVFGVEPSVAGKGKGKSQTGPANKIKEISKLQLFAEPDEDTYQRVIRLSKPYPQSAQLGAITTGLGKAQEIVVFDTAAPATSIWSYRTMKRTVDGKQTKEVETVDMDFLQTDDDEYILAYCDAHEIYVKELSTRSNDGGPRRVYVTPYSDRVEKPTVPKFSALRWLTKELILTLTNIHGSSGVVLQIFRIPAPGVGDGLARLVQSYKLPSSISKAGQLTVANLTPPISPSDPQGYTQFVIAVGANDKSISLFKADLQVVSKVSLITEIKPFRTFKSAHADAIAVTGLSFSNFTPPTTPITASTPPQHLKLASIGSHSVVVHTLPLFPVPLSVARGQSKTPRYVVFLPSKALARGIMGVTAILGTIFLAIFVQAILEIRGDITPRLNAKAYIPNLMQESWGKPYVFPDNYPLSVPSTLEEIHATLKNGGGQSVVYVQDTPEGKVQVGGEKGEGEGTMWEELSEKHQGEWKKKLVDAGHWAEDMGETILKGVVFGELGGLVGQVVAG